MSQVTASEVNITSWLYQTRGASVENMALQAAGRRNVSIAFSHLFIVSKRTRSNNLIVLK